MATAEEQLAALKEALRIGVTSVAYDGKSTTYRSAQEMREIIASLEREIAGRTVPTSAVVRTSKGW